MSTAPSAEPRRKSLVLVHGRGQKPEAPALAALWREALEAGLARDFADAGGATLLQPVDVDFVYYGDLSNARRQRVTALEDPALDLADRRNALRTLEALDRKKAFRRSGYESVPGRSSLREFVADLGAPLLSTLRLTDRALSRRMPEVTDYLDPAKDFGEQLRSRLRQALSPRLQAGDDLMIIAHCLGSIAAFDALWQLSHDDRFRPAVQHRVQNFVTLGSPLADEYVKHHLLGAHEPPERRYPELLVSWHNVAAEDDFTCHDETMANDYRAMLDGHRLSEIRDYRIYNLAIRFGRSNPHHDAGYLIHPRMARLLADWLQSG